MNDQEIERELQAKGLNAPRITPADLEAVIVSEHYFTAGDGVHGDALRDSANEGRSVYPSSLDLLTFCVLVLKNGFTVTGKSACASPENFNAETGRKLARANAINELWPLLGYQLKQRLFEESRG